MKQSSLQNQVLISKDIYTPSKLYHFVLFLFDTTDYGDNSDWVFDPKSVLKRW